MREGGHASRGVEHSQGDHLLVVDMGGLELNVGKHDGREFLEGEIDAHKEWLFQLSFVVYYVLLEEVYNGVYHYRILCL